MATKREDNAIYRIPPYYYIHVLDQNTNVTNIEIGPQTYIRKDNQRVTLGPEKMVVVPPRHYCVIENPVSRDENGKPVIDRLGQIKLQHADQEIRLTQDPFPLFPGEVLKQPVSPLKVVPANAALRIRAILDFEDEGGEKRTAGDEWLFEGPGTVLYRTFVIASGFNSLLKPACELLSKVPHRYCKKTRVDNCRKKLLNCLKDTDVVQGTVKVLFILTFSLALIVFLPSYLGVWDILLGTTISYVIKICGTKAVLVLDAMLFICCVVVFLQEFFYHRHSKLQSRRKLEPGRPCDFKTCVYNCIN